MTISSLISPSSTSTQLEPESKTPTSSHHTIRKQATAVDHGIASNIAGSVTAICFHPLDLIKVRIVSQDGTDLRKHRGQSYRSFSHALSSIIKLEGARALFRGAPLGVFASGVTWGLYMTVYRWMEEGFLSLWFSFVTGACESTGSTNGSEINDNNSSKTKRHISPSATTLPVSVVASATASVCVSFLTCPLFLIKTRMMLEDVDARTQTRINRTFFHGLSEAVTRDGVTSLWRGFSAQLVMCCLMSLYMPMYEVIRGAACRKLDKEKLSKIETTGVTICAKLGVTLASHPVGLIKARLQDARARGADIPHASKQVMSNAAAAATNNWLLKSPPVSSSSSSPSSSSSVRYVSFADAFGTILKREGFFGFYRGITVGLAQSTGRAICQMLIYEEVLTQVVTFRKATRSSRSSFGGG